MKYNAPPGWPEPPTGWSPPEGWEPDASWPPAPAGWIFWTSDGDPGPDPGASGPVYGTPDLAKTTTEAWRTGKVQAGKGPTSTAAAPHRASGARGTTIPGARPAVESASPVGHRSGVAAPSSPQPARGAPSSQRPARARAPMHGPRTGRPTLWTARRNRQRSPGGAIATALAIGALFLLTQCSGGDPSSDSFIPPSMPAPAPTLPQMPVTTLTRIPIGDGIPGARIYVGTGNATFAIDKPDGADSPAILRATAPDGDRQFSVGTRGTDGFVEVTSAVFGWPSTTDTLVDYPHGTTTEVSVHSEGTWTIEILSMREATTVAEATSGAGNAVILWTGPPGQATVTKDYDSLAEFRVLDATDAALLLAQESQLTSGALTVTTTPVLIEIRTRGNWTFTMGAPTGE